jgi:hypothetical protein
VVHPLPAAPHFVGRAEEKDRLRSFWETRTAGVVAIVGLGGAGKTALAAHFVNDLLSSNGTERPAGLFVWSFYVEPDPGRFLQEAYRYFFGPDATVTPAKGSGLLHLLRDALSSGSRYLLVLDGLEKVQRQEDSPAGDYGQIEDPLLKAFLLRVGEGLGNTVALVTSRFILTDLERSANRGYYQIDVGGLELSAAIELLRHRGVKGTDECLSELIDQYGAHALTLDHLGGLVAQFRAGDPSRAPELAPGINPGSDRQALRLARLLRAYEDHLPPAELKLLCQLCLLRRGMPEEHIQQLFLCSPPVHLRTIREIRQAVLHLTDKQDLADSIFDFLQEALCTAAIAGPADVFSQEIISAAAKVVEKHEKDADPQFEDIARLCDKLLDPPTDRRPLSANDRRNFHALYQRYLELRAHPLMPYKESGASNMEWLKKAGLGKHILAAESTTVLDVLYSFQRCQRHLRYLVFKHFALQRIRELCRLYQNKWVLAGPLAMLDRQELGQALDRLVERHLLLKETGRSFNAHPAVRDHFARRAQSADAQTWHDLIREQLISLSERPGAGFADRPATLDFVEEAIYHALQAGKTADALGLYHQVLGGVRHLGWKLGEMSRGLRILRGFDRCPEPWDLAWYLRALGELEEAYERQPLPYFRADIRLLQGRLPEAIAEGDDTRQAVAAFLLGKSKVVPPDVLGYAIPRAQIFLLMGRLDEARRAAGLADCYGAITWEGERSRSTLFLAEVARRQADHDACRRQLEAASGWILHSGSVEHLCLLHLMRSRLAQSTGDLTFAQRAVDEGTYIAGHSGLGIYHIELLCEQAEIALASSQFQLAETAARQALQRAAAADCRFVWGAGRAGCLLGKTLIAQERFREARPVLRDSLDVQKSIGDPSAALTQRLIDSLPE